MAPLLRTDLTGPGIRRRRCGRGFRYFAASGAPLTDARALARIKALVIPPAWEDVWICPHPRGHIQAVGTDAAGRRQYLYHDLWRERRDQEKFDRVMEFGRTLPRVRAVVERHLHGQGLCRDRVLATAVRLIDLGFFRPGGEEYAAENGTFGLATIRREHVTCGKGELSFEYTGKSGKQREQAVADEGQARQTMHRLWPNDSIPGESAQLLPLPRHFRQLAELVTKDMVTAPCGPDPGPYVEAIRAYEEAGFDEVYLGQVGGRLEDAFEFFATQVLPQVRKG
jgi:DNA topoisomerase IB